MKVLVTGANGQLGQCLQKIEKEYSQIDFFFRTSEELNITSLDSIKSNFELFKPDFCINCAAYTNVDQAEKESKKAFAVNAEGVKNLSKVCKNYGTVLIHISTDYVFDGEKTGPYTVDDIPNPINQYGKSKLKGEEYIQEILEKYFIVRTSWLYSEFGKNFYKTILEKAKTEKIIYVTNEQTGCPTNANNLAKFLVELVISNEERYRIIHFADFEQMTWFEFVKKIAKENKLKAKVIAREYSSFAARPENSTLQNN
ncbi:dTDP-4-dehydrorhamnose reductase [Spongiivirga sp. MCCC 1A20706]|uniref:dTDP-4-dehydrorhamnose reductase n=1 Tax=Spongiivirga sp. MCCC 1A20706 TaxID=3160963 RepID=UPI003977B106